MYQHNFSDLYINTIFPTYIRLNQQVTVSQKSFHNRLNNETFTHMQKKLKYLLRRRSQGREGNRLNIHCNKTIYALCTCNESMKKLLEASWHTQVSTLSDRQCLIICQSLVVAIGVRFAIIYQISLVVIR